MSNNKITIDMFTQKFNKKRFTPIAFVGVLTLLLSSCGTHNNSNYNTDGIYSSGNGSQSEEVYSNTSNERANYYQQYFRSKAEAYSDLPEEGAIFTDIDAYSTTERLDENGNIVIEENYHDEGYGAWGNNANEITINIFNTGGYGYGFYHRPYWYGRPYWQGGYWGSPYYGSYWGMNFDWGYPYYGYGYGYGHGYGYPYYGHGYYNPYYYNNNGYFNGVSYNRGRRNTDYTRTQARGRSSNVSTRNSSYSRSETTRRVNNNNVRANSNTRSSNSSIIRSNTTRNNNVRSNNVRSNNVRNNSSNTIPTIQNTRSNTNRNSSYSQPTRSSNTTRSNNMSTPTRSSGNSGSIRSSGGSGGRSSSGGTRSGVRGRG